MIPWQSSGATQNPKLALQIKPHGQTCIMPFFAQVATRGKTAVFDRESYGCPGARAGLGFGSGYPDAFGGAGVEFMSALFVKGKESAANPESYCAPVRHIPERERAKFIHGERLHKDPEKAKRFMTEELPITDIAEKYVIFKPLGSVLRDEYPVVIVFVASPLLIAGLVTLVSAIREGTDAVRVPPMAACQQIGAFVCDEAKREHPRAVLGYTDWRHGRTWERSSPIPYSPLPYPGNSFLRWKRKRGTAYSTARSGKIWHRRRKCYHDKRKFQGDRTEAGICVQASPMAARNIRSETLPAIVSTSRR